MRRLVATAVAVAFVLASASVEARPDPEADYLPKVKPLLAKHCFACHGPEKQKGKLRLDNLDTDFVNGPDAEKWREALHRLNAGEMPPEDEPQPNPAERETLTDWLTASLRHAAEVRRSQGGDVTFRRLNRREYENTLADLFGFRLNVASMLPPERPSEDGFLNNARDLVVSPLHFESYLKIARLYLGKAVVTGAPPPRSGFYGEFQAAGKNPKFGNYRNLSDPGGQAINANAALRQGKNGRQATVLPHTVVLPPALRATGTYIPARQGPKPALQIRLRDFPDEGEALIRIRASALPPELLGDLPPADQTFSVKKFKGKGGHVRVELYAPNLPDADLRSYAKRNPLAQTRSPDFGLRSLGVPIESISLKFTALLNVSKPGEYHFFTSSDDGSRLYLDGALVVNNDGLHGMSEKTGSLHLTPGKRKLEVTYFDNGGGDGLLVSWQGPDLPKRLIQAGDLAPLPKDKTAPKPPALAQKPEKAKTEPKPKPFTGPYPFLGLLVGNHLDDGVELAQVGQPVEVKATPEKPQTYEFRARLENLPLPFREKNATRGGDLDQAMLMLKNAYEPDPGQPEPRLQIHSVEFLAPHHEQWPPASHKAIFIDSPNRHDESAYAREIFTRFLRRAYRRPPTETETERLLHLWRAYRQSHQREFGEPPTFVEGIRETLPAALVSPAFLYLVEPSEDKRPRPLDDHEVAARLSYFLTGSAPDETLADLADQDALRSEQTLRQQTRRLLQSPRSDEFIANFIDQWLELDLLDRIAVDRKRHPTYQPYMRQAMREETRGYFAHLLRQDLSALHLLRSDFAYLNPLLAKHYGLPEVRGAAFRLVSLPPEHPRGGLLTQASFLTANSTGTDSHPIKRGTWLLKKLLDDPPPPPPPNVPELDPKDPELSGKPLKEQLALHRDNPACANCHRKIDPFGIPFENFNTVGQWREKAGSHEINATATLPDGVTISGVAELQNHLLETRPDQFARALTRKLLAYALGRPLTFADDETIDHLAVDFRKSDHRLRPLIEAIVLSDSFRRK